MTEKEFKIKVFPLKDKLYRFALRILCDEAEAQDATQEVLIKLWDIRKKLAEYNSIEALAMTSVRNLSLDRIRKKKLRIEKSSELKQELPTVAMDNNFENAEIKQLVNNAIKNLKEPHRTIMHLRDVEQYDFEEIEPIVNMSTETIRVYLSRARKNVREELQKIMNYGIAKV